MMNPNMIRMVQALMSNGDPQTAVLNMLESQAGSGNPLLSNLLQMAKSGNGKEIENIARNMMKEQGRDFDKEFLNFKNSLGLK